MFYRSNKWRSGAVRGPASARKAAIRSNQKQDSPNQTPFRRTQPQPCKITLQAFPPKVALIGTIWMAAALLLHRPRGTGTASGGPRLRGQEWNATNLPWDSGGVHSKSFFHQDVASVLALGLATPGLLIEAEICWLIAIHRERCGCSPEQKSLQLHRQGQNSKIAVFQFQFFSCSVTVVISGQIQRFLVKIKIPPRLCFCWRGKEEGIGACWGIPRITFRHPPGHSTRISAGTAAHCWHLLHFYPTHDLGKKTKSLSWVDLGETHLATAAGVHGRVLTSVELSDGAKAIGKRACSGEGPAVCPQGD